MVVFFFRVCWDVRQTLQTHAHGMHVRKLGNVGFCGFRGVRDRAYAHGAIAQLPCNTSHIAATTTPMGTSGALQLVRSRSGRFASRARTWVGAKTGTPTLAEF